MALFRCGAGSQVTHSITFNGTRGVSTPNGSYFINGVSTPFSGWLSTAADFCTTAESGVTYTESGKYMELVTSGTTSSIQIVDRAVGDSITFWPSAANQSYSVSIIKL